MSYHIPKENKLKKLKRSPLIYFRMKEVKMAEDCSYALKLHAVWVRVQVSIIPII